MGLMIDQQRQSLLSIGAGATNPMLTMEVEMAMPAACRAARHVMDDDAMEMPIGSTERWHGWRHDGRNLR